MGFNLNKQSMFSQLTALEHAFSSHILVSLPSALPRPLLSSSPLHTPVTPLTHSASLDAAALT